MKNELRSDLVLKEVFCKMVKNTHPETETKGKNNKGSRTAMRSIDLMELSLLNVS